MKDKLIIGTRGSNLALWQANWVKERLKEWYPSLNVTLEIIKTQGDKILDVPLAKIGDKGLFVKELETAILTGKVDLAVHSMKDLPTQLPEDLTIAAITEREDPRDVFISKNGAAFCDLPPGAVIGTGSLRRRSQLFNWKPSLKINELRGNLDTRIKKLDQGDYDAIILAAAGVLRMGWKDRITEFLPIDKMLPAVGQGALGIEIKKNDPDVCELIQKFNHTQTYLAVTAERAFLKRLEGGCQVPIAAFGTVTNDTLLKIELEGLVASIDGKNYIRKQASAAKDNAEALGCSLAEKLLQLGADKILNEIYGRS